MAVATPRSTSLTITNPLVQYRTLIATKQLKPDASQLRVAVHLQKLYFELKDYEPELDYRDRLDNLSRSLGKVQSIRALGERMRPWTSIWSPDRRSEEELALTLSKSDLDSVRNMASPRGLLLHGEVGRGKSMLIDLLANSLPTHRKRRWHFNNFMLEVIRRLEKQRIAAPSPTSFRDPYEEHSITALAKDFVSVSPIIFLDEFQLPDRATSRLLCPLLVSFFQMGGVLIATSNRLPEDLAKASGIDFRSSYSRPEVSVNRLSSRRGIFKAQIDEVARSNDFHVFLDILRSRCDTLEMEGDKDWRREEYTGEEISIDGHLDDLDPDYTSIIKRHKEVRECKAKHQIHSDGTPTYFYVHSSGEASLPGEECPAWTRIVDIVLSEVGSTVEQWQTGHLYVYGRKLHVPRQRAGITMWDFSELCGSNLGPADYISLAASYHTLILDRVPALSSDLKNEARRFITLLDALYEARCRLLIRADVNIDDLFFPETRGNGKDRSAENIDDDNVWQETFSEIYQDTNFPFRPNTSVYEGERRTLIEYEPCEPFNLSEFKRDRPQTFGPRMDVPTCRQAVDNDSTSENRLPGVNAEHCSGQRPDFTRPVLYIGEDEKFAFRRAQSRIWEMCGSRWWNRTTTNWWRPLHVHNRHWESRSAASSTFCNTASQHDREPARHHDVTQTDASDSPPNFSWVHAWGMIKWGRRAGRWGQGPEGLKDKNNA